MVSYDSLLSAELGFLRTHPLSSNPATGFVNPGQWVHGSLRIAMTKQESWPLMRTTEEAVSSSFGQGYGERRFSF